jgi:D-alanyl-D-alanine carboxypeptidase
VPHESTLRSVAAHAGASWSYSNTNYIALGLVVEKVTGNSIRQELVRRITRPLARSSSFAAH